MSAYDQGPLAKYNSLTDRHLMSYFSNDRMRRHLIKNGLITKGGEVVSDAVYRVRIARREHRRRVRDLIAQAIIHKALEMERSRQIDIRKKIEEIAKIELVRRVRTDCNRIGDEECLSYFNEGNMETKPRPKSQKNGKLKSRSDMEEARLPATPDQESRQRLRKILPNEEIETKHLSQLDSLTLGEYARILEKHDQHRIDKLPYLGMGSEYVRHNMKQQDGKGTKTKKNRTSKKSKKTDEAQDSNGIQSARSSQAKGQAHTVVTILFHAPSNSRNFDVMVVQQPSGGNTLILYKESISNNTVFQVTSHRHKGFPFSLTFFLDNVKDSRISTCCEYKHKVGKRIGGPSGHFTLFSVEGDNPCFRCLAERDLANEKKENKSKDTKSNEQLSSRHETISVRSASEDKYKSDNDFEEFSDSSTTVTEDEEEGEHNDDAEKSNSQSRHSSSSKTSQDHAVISVNIHDQARSQTPEIEVNCEDSSEKHDVVAVMSSNNNAIEGDNHDHENKLRPDDEAVLNSDRTSIWTVRSDQVDEINQGHGKVDTKEEMKSENEHKIEINTSTNDVSRKPSTSSSSSSETDNNLVKISMPTEAVTSRDENRIKIDSSDKSTNDDSDSEESSTKDVVISANKPNTFLNQLVDDKSESDSSRSGKKIGYSMTTKPSKVDAMSSSSSGSVSSRSNQEGKSYGYSKNAKLDNSHESVVMNQQTTLEASRINSGSSSGSSSGRSLDNRQKDKETHGTIDDTINVDDEVVVVKTVSPEYSIRISPDVQNQAATESNDIVESPRANQSPKENVNPIQPEVAAVSAPRKMSAVSESGSDDYTSSSESAGTNSESSAARNVNPVLSTSALTDTERESLKIDLPKEEDDDEDNNSLKFDDKPVEEPRPMTASPRQYGISMARSSLSDSLSSNESRSNLDHKVQNQADEEKNVNIEEESGSSRNTNEEFDVFFSNDDITFKKAKEMFEQVNDQRITSLTVRNCELPSYIFNFIANKLESKKDLKRIELSGCEVEIGLLKLLAKTLEKWPCLDRLILSNNVFVDYSLFDLVNTLVQVYSHEKVTDRQTLNLLDLSNCSLQENDFSQILKMISENTCVENIVLDRNSIDRNMWLELRVAILNNTNTKSVSIKNCIDDGALFNEINDETVTEIRKRIIIN